MDDVFLGGSSLMMNENSNDAVILAQATILSRGIVESDESPSAYAVG
jgi:hypothetical protein